MAMTMMVKFSNARLTAEYDDWPIGGSNRGQCKFAVEDGGRRGTRVSRTTTDKHGRWCKPKYTTYASHHAIVDGDDGKTYILSLTDYGFVSIKRHDFMSAERSGSFNNDADFAELVELVKSAK
jgi:hypothetical protein